MKIKATYDGISPYDQKELIASLPKNIQNFNRDVLSAIYRDDLMSSLRALPILSQHEEYLPIVVDAFIDGIAKYFEEMK